MFTPDTAKTVTIAEAVDAKCTDLTETQRTALKDRFAKLGFGNEMCSFSAGSIIDTWRQQAPDVYRAPPSVEQLTSCLIANMTETLGIERVDGMEKIKIARRVAAMSVQERLDASAGLKIEPAESLTTAPAPTPTDKPFTAMSDDAIDGATAERMGFTSIATFRAATLPSKILEYRRQLRKQDVAPSPALREAKAAGRATDALDPKFANLSPTERITLYRAQQKAAGNR